LGSPLGALVKADAEKWWPIIKTPGLRQSDAATVTRAKGCAFDACNPANCQCRLRVKLSRATHLVGTADLTTVSGPAGPAVGASGSGQHRTSTVAYLAQYDLIKLALVRSN
jgi:hypothetical protein